MNTERHEHAIEANHTNILVRERISQDTVLARATALVCGGQPTAVLGGITHGLPMLLAYTGSGTDEIAAACREAGAALTVNARELDWREFDAKLDRVLAGESRAQSRKLRDAFRRHDGQREVALRLEALVGSSSALEAAV